MDESKRIAMEVQHLRDREAKMTIARKQRQAAAEAEADVEDAKATLLFLGSGRSPEPLHHHADFEAKVFDQEMTVMQARSYPPGPGLLVGTSDSDEHRRYHRALSAIGALKG